MHNVDVVLSLKYPLSGAKHAFRSVVRSFPFSGENTAFMLAARRSHFQIQLSKSAANLSFPFPTVAATSQPKHSHSSSSPDHDSHSGPSAAAAAAAALPLFDPSRGPAAVEPRDEAPAPPPARAVSAALGRQGLRTCWLLRRLPAARERPECSQCEAGGRDAAGGQQRHRPPDRNFSTAGARGDDRRLGAGRRGLQQAHRVSERTCVTHSLLTIDGRIFTICAAVSCRRMGQALGDRSALTAAGGRLEAKWCMVIRTPLALKRPATGCL